MKQLLYAATGLAAVAILPATAAKAQDASWGCQVLLCAASQNPSWHGVSYCVQPMTKLIRAMAKPGFSWPVCHEAKAGEPGRQEYADCPEGSKVGYSERGKEGNRRVPDQCVKTVNVCKSRFNSQADKNGLTIPVRRAGRDSDNRSGSCTKEISSMRPRRADPWYFDIPNDQGVKQRHWFNLNL
ncbi:hypothetical protein [Mesorhizobium sp. ISC15]|uniref:hypothetical protein n=1 Tax=Mesorhizobium sp. ISC15 TaxID=3076429 RepID=UPI00301BBED9